MILYRVYITMFKMMKKAIFPFLFYLFFWCMNIYTLVYIPGVSDVAYIRVFAAILFPVGIVFGMFDSVVMLIGWLVSL